MTMIPTWVFWTEAGCWAVQMFLSWRMGRRLRIVSADLDRVTAERDEAQAWERYYQQKLDALGARGWGG